MDFNKGKTIPGFLQIGFPEIFDELVLCVGEIAGVLLGEIHDKGRRKGREGID